VVLDLVVQEDQLETLDRLGPQAELDRKEDQATVVNPDHQDHLVQLVDKVRLVSLDRAVLLDQPEMKVGQVVQE
jgi:type IV secretory pathway TrbF-like protein